MNGDAAREKLAAAMTASLGICLNDLLDALLPVVREIAADELRAAADAAHDEYSGWEAAAVVRARADALHPGQPS